MYKGITAGTVFGQLLADLAAPHLQLICERIEIGLVDTGTIITTVRMSYYINAARRTNEEIKIETKEIGRPLSSLG